MNGKENGVPNSLEEQNRRLLDEIIKLRSRPKGRIGYVLLGAGLILFSLSVDYYSYIMAFFSLGFVFLGGLFLYIRPTNYMRREIILSVIKEIYSFYHLLLSSMDYRGAPHYLQSTALADFSNVYMYIPKREGDGLNYENVKAQEGFSHPEFLRLVPPGLGLTKLAEKETGTAFSSLDVNHVLNLLSRVFTEDLELLKSFEFKGDNSSIEVKLSEALLNEAPGETTVNGEPEGVLLDYINCSIACAIAKSTGRPVVVHKYIKRIKGETTTVFKIL